MIIRDVLLFDEQMRIASAGHIVSPLSKLCYDIGGNGLNGVLWFYSGSWFYWEYGQSKVLSADSAFDVLALAVTST